MGRRGQVRKELKSNGFSNKVVIDDFGRDSVHGIVGTEGRSSGLRNNWEVRSLAKLFKKLGCEEVKRDDS